MGPDNILSKTLKPDNGPIGVYRAVRQTGNDVGRQTTTAGEYFVGFAQEEIDQEDYDRGRLCTVRINGISRAVAATALTVGTRVTTDNQGRVVAATAGQYVIGRVVTPVTQANDWTAVNITNEGNA